MRVGFVLRSTEIKPLFWDLFDEKLTLSSLRLEHSTKITPAWVLLQYTHTWVSVDTVILETNVLSYRRTHMRTTLFWIWRKRADKRTYWIFIKTKTQHTTRLGHIKWPAPTLIRTSKLSHLERSQYVRGRPGWKPACWVFFVFLGRKLLLESIL